MNRESLPVPPKSLAVVLAHIADGGSVYVATYLRFILIDAKLLARFRKAGAWLLKEDGEGYRLQTGRTSVYLLPGQLRFSERGQS